MSRKKIAARKSREYDDLDIMGESGSAVEDITAMGDHPTETTEQDRYVAQVLGVFRPDADFDRERSDANSELIQVVAQYLVDNPQQRFGQALKNLDLASPDVALVEPQVQLNRAKAALRRR